MKILILLVLRGVFLPLVVVACVVLGIEIHRYLLPEIWATQHTSHEMKQRLDGPYIGVADGAGGWRFVGGPVSEDKDDSLTKPDLDKNLWPIEIDGKSIGLREFFYNDEPFSHFEVWRRGTAMAKPVAIVEKGGRTK